ncbi:MAG: hypothetical protein GY705_24000 [Bacteroidetes bacterium]|nr:hypothetical protein [Bacteroidota bacterium]
MRKRYRRSAKNYFLKKNLQGKLVLTMFLSGLGGCISIILLMAVFSADTLTISYSDNNIHMGNTPFMLVKHALAANWIFVAIGGSLITLTAMIGTHRIAGPLFRLESTLKEMKKGNLNNPIKLRESDEGKQLAHHINNFNSRLSANLYRIKKCSQSIDELIHQYETSGKTITYEEREMIFRSIRNKNDIVQSILSNYTL